jgi:carotenoid cleavage dioxygenase
MTTNPARTNLAPIPMGFSAPKITGELPRGLGGTLYRNGPIPIRRPRRTGSSATACCTPSISRQLSQRWVRTPKWQAEHDADRALFGGFGRKPGTPAEITSEAASPAPTPCAGRLLALEEGHMPTEIEPGTLNQRGYCDYAIAAPSS